MADEKVKVSIDPNSISGLDELGKKIGENVKKGVTDGLESNEVKKKIDETFSAKGLKDGLKKTLASVFSDSAKTEKKQAKVADHLAKHVDLQKNFTKLAGEGAKKSELLSAGLKLAGNQAAGMLANMNLYIVAAKVAVRVIQEFADQYQRVAEQSAKFISQSSLFTDKATMQMMQRTGQQASGAQGTNRALDRLGISFEDLQSGMVTDAQVKMFEKIRKEETERLEMIARVGGPTFEAMQHGAVAVASAKQKIEDAVTFVFAKSKGVMQFAKSLESMAGRVGDFLWTGIQMLEPIVSAVSNVLAIVMEAVGGILDVATIIYSAVTPIYSTISSILDVAGKYFTQVVKNLSRVVNAVLKPVMKIAGMIIENIITPIMWVVDIVSAIIDASMAAVEPVFQIMEIVGDSIGMIAEVFMPSLKSMTPVIEFIVKLIELFGASVAWVVSKVAEAIKWISDMVVTGVNYIINLIPKGVHQMISNIVDLMNKIPGVNIKIGEYKPIDVSKMMSGITGSIDNAITNIQGDTFNYNTTNNDNRSQNANQNLFANNYVLVND